MIPTGIIMMVHYDAGAGQKISSEPEFQAQELGVRISAPTFGPGAPGGPIIP